MKKLVSYTGKHSFYRYPVMSQSHPGECYFLHKVVWAPNEKHSLSFYLTRALLFITEMTGTSFSPILQPTFLSVAISFFYILTPFPCLLTGMQEISNCVLLKEGQLLWMQISFIKWIWERGFTKISNRDLNINVNIILAWSSVTWNRFWVCSTSSIHYNHKKLLLLESLEEIFFTNNFVCFSLSLRIWIAIFRNQIIIENFYSFAVLLLPTNLALKK